MASHEPLAKRTRLDHTPPNWVMNGAVYFITICALERNTACLISEKSGPVILGAIENYHDRGKWWCRIGLIMPDHCHFLVSFPKTSRIVETIGSWKSYTARATGTPWQTDFFEHRLRSNESLDEKTFYILNNPVRRGLVETAEKWPWIFRGRLGSGVPGTTRPT